ncbi:MAG: DNA mismatch repair protein MutS [Clostridia bacterium]|nr:DNA mismatch repair protein MutS [Clostridia bacterium]
MAISPMMQHYLTVKEDYKDCFLFYRLGDFYELFFDDAVKASEILGLVLTGKDCGLEDRAPMCGVPFHAVDSYVSKIIDAGGKVAICEQLEDPATAKGIVKRGVVRVITAGTVTEEGQLEEGLNSFLSSVYKKGDSIGLAWADITTGEFYCRDFFGDEAMAELLSCLQKLSVKEIIGNQEMAEASARIFEFQRGYLPKVALEPDLSFYETSAREALFRQFGVKTLDAYAVNGKSEALSASGALVAYLSKTQMRALSHMNDLKYISETSHMSISETAVRNLELVRSLSEEKKYGSLLWLLDKTKTAMGARLLYSSILNPLQSESEINYRLDGVEALYSSSVVRMSLSELLRQIKDIERLTGKISNGNLNPRDMVALSVSLTVVPNIKFQISGFDAKILKDISNSLRDMSDVVKLISKAIVDENTPAATKDGGFVREGYSAELDELRGMKKNSTKILTDLENTEREKTGIKTLKVGYNKIFGYYIEITNSFLDKVPERYVRRQTLTGAERFIIPELKDIEDKILYAEERQVKLECEIFDKILSLLSEKISAFKEISEAISLLDLICAFAEVSKNSKYVRPEIKVAGEPLIIKDGRHPVVEALSKEKFIPNDALLDGDENRTIILTGPNMAGKSTYMRQIAVITIMAHIGCFVPASKASIPLTDKIFTRVGASDNLIMDQSTFMVEMIEVASIIKNATKNSLLILDEVGRGTSTYDGLAIAWAVIEHITKNIGAKTLFATHYHELTDLESILPGVKNYKISVREINGEIVFLRKIMRGAANRSFGIEVAAFAGVPKEVTEKAKELLKTIEKGGKKISAADISPEAGKSDEKSEVEKILSELDLNSLSPMQAFMVLTDLCEKVKNG